MRPAGISRRHPDELTKEELEKLKSVTERMPDFVSAESRFAINRALSALPRLIAEVERLRQELEHEGPSDFNWFEHMLVYQENARELFELLQETRTYVERVAAPHLVLPPEDEWGARQLLRELDGARIRKP